MSIKRPYAGSILSLTDLLPLSVARKEIAPPIARTPTKAGMMPATALVSTPSRFFNRVARKVEKNIPKPVEAAVNPSAYEIRVGGTTNVV